MEVFLEERPRLVANVRNAVEINDSIALGRAAHALKGSVANFAARHALNAAIHLEEVAPGNDPAETNRALAKLEEELDKLSSVLASFELEKAA